jgi:hypothetical protein
MQQIPTTPVTVSQQTTAIVSVTSPTTTIGGVTNQSVTTSSINKLGFGVTWSEQLNTWETSEMPWASITDKTMIINV